MASLMDYQFCGVYYIVLGLWWMFSVFYRHSTSTRFRLPFHSSSWFLCSFFPNAPIEPLVTLVVFLAISIIKVISEAQNQEEFHWTDAWLLSFYSMRMLTALVQILRFHFRKLLPSGLDYVCLMLATGLHIVQFLCSIRDHTPIKTPLHDVIVYVLTMLFLDTFYELLHDECLLFAFSRGGLMFLSGLNVYYAGSSVFSPTEKGEVSVQDYSILFCVELIVTIGAAFTMKMLADDLMDDAVPENVTQDNEFEKHGGGDGFICGRDSHVVKGSESTDSWHYTYTNQLKQVWTI